MASTEQNLDPRIGILTSNGRAVYYAFVKGYGQAEVRGSLAKVEKALGIRKPAARKSFIDLRPYLVTITPKIITYDGGDIYGCAQSQVYGEYEVEVFARDAKEALKDARRQRRDEEGRLGIPATFRARRAA